MDTLDTHAPDTFDLVIVGAGLHGASIAAEAASRGLKCLLVHAKDIGGSASCFPSTIVGAGLPQLEHLQVPDLLGNAEALSQLRKIAPHLVQPRALYIARNQEVRSNKKVQLGIGIYKRFLTKEQVPSSADIALTHFHEDQFFRKPVVEYSVNCLRLVIALVKQFESYGGDFRTHHELVAAKRNPSHWDLTLQDKVEDKPKGFKAKILVNCTGYQSDELLENRLGVKTRSALNEYSVAHLFIRARPDFVQSLDKSGLIFQLPDPQRRLVYASPYDEQHICIGPIYAPHAHEDIEKSRQESIDQTLGCINRYFHLPLSSADIVHSRWAHVSKLDDPSQCQAAQLQHSCLDLNNPGGAAPLLTHFGVHLSRFRKIAEQALEILEVFTNAKINRAHKARALPGAEDLDRFKSDYFAQFDGLPKALLERLYRTYGTQAASILDGVKSEHDLGSEYGSQLYEREIDFLKLQEWSRSAEDIIWRRNYLGLYFSPEDTHNLEQYLDKNCS